MADYSDYQPSTAPAWMQSGNARAWWTALGQVKDEVVALIKDALTSGMPLLSPPDGLARIGQSRMLPRYGTESDEGYALRLWNAWQAWERAGTPLGLLLALEAAGYQAVLVQQVERGFTLDADTTLDDRARLQIHTLDPNRDEVTHGWSFDDRPAFWSRFGVLLYDPPASWTNIVDPPTDDSSPPRAEVNIIRRIIRKWKPAKATCFGIYVRKSGLILGWPPGQALGDTGLVLGGDALMWTYPEN